MQYICRSLDYTLLDIYIAMYYCGLNAMSCNETKNVIVLQNATLIFDHTTTVHISRDDICTQIIADSCGDVTYIFQRC